MTGSRNINKQGQGGEEQDYTLTRQTAEEVVVVIQHQSTRALLTTKYTGNSGAILH